MVIGDGPGIAKKEGSTGKPWGARVAIVDDMLTPLPADEIGTLAFGAEYPGFFLGYLGDEATTRRRCAAAISSPAISPAWTTTATSSSSAAPTTASKARAC